MKRAILALSILTLASPAAATAATKHFRQTVYFQKGFGFLTIGGAQRVIGAVALTKIGENMYAVTFPGTDLVVGFMSLDYAWIGQQLTLRVSSMKITGSGVSTGNPVTSASGQCLVEAGSGVTTLDKVTCSSDSVLGQVQLEFDGDKTAAEVSTRP